MGAWSQRGINIPLTFKKTEKPSEVSQAHRTPKPPYPYKIENVTYRSDPAGVMLAGTLTRPVGTGPFQRRRF